MKRKLVYAVGGLAAYVTGVGAFMAFRTQPAPSTPTQTDTSQDTTNHSGATSKEETKAIYNSLATTYDSKVGLDETLIGITRLRKSLAQQARGHVLELCAGSGRNFQFYPKESYIVAVDQSDKMIEQARKKKQTNVDFQVVDVHHLPYQSRSFDAIVDSFGLCSMENPVQVLREAQRVCKEDGKILLLEHGRSSWNWLANYMNKNAHKHATNWGCWYNRDILKIVQEAGLDIISVKRKHFGTTYFITAKPGPEYRSSEGTSNASFNHEAN